MTLKMLFLVKSLVIIHNRSAVGFLRTLEKKMKQPWRFVAVVCSALLASAALGTGSTEAGSKGITFLHLRATADGFELVEAKTVDGSLRVRRYDSAKTGLHVEVRSADDRVLFRDVHPDPTVTRLEYEDPEHPGKIRAKEITNQEFTIRVPYFADARIVHFYRRLEGRVSGSNRPLLIHQGQVTLPSK
jgi:hypothetical protein